MSNDTIAIVYIILIVFQLELATTPEMAESDGRTNDDRAVSSKASIQKDTMMGCIVGGAIASFFLQNLY